MDRARDRRQSCGRDDPGPPNGAGEGISAAAIPVSGRPTPAIAARVPASRGAASACRPRAPGPRTDPRRAAGSRRGRPSRRAAATAAEAAIPTEVSSMQPRNVRKPSSRARSSIRRAGPTPPHFASLTLTPATTPTRASRSSIVTRALVGDDRQRRPLLEPAQVVEAPRRERLLDQLDAEPLELGEQRRGLLGRPAGVRVDPDRARVHGAHRLERLEVGRAADLDLERREVARPGAPARRRRRARRCRA